METTLRQPAMQGAGTISEETRDSLHTIDELGAALTSIHVEKLVEPDWKDQPMRSWSEVYDELCCEVGQVYGLNDIREA